MKTIHKYRLEILDKQSISMPRGAALLCVQVQGRTACLWAQVDPSQPWEVRDIAIHGTGNPMDDEPRDYIGTVQVGPFVWHVFDETPNRE